jgi:hypothetical protein
MAQSSVERRLCVTAKCLNSKDCDAVTQMTQKIRREYLRRTLLPFELRGHHWCSRLPARRQLDPQPTPNARFCFRPQRTQTGGVLRSTNPLIQKEAYAPNAPNAKMQGHSF